MRTNWLVLAAASVVVSFSGCGRAERIVAASDCASSDDTLTYDQVQQRAIHNAYTESMREGLMDQLVYYRVRNLEWDIHSAKPFTAERGPGNDWFMYHTTGAGDHGRCYKLSDCLRLLKAFQDAVPEHEVITIQLELKGGGEGSLPSVFLGEGVTDPDLQTPDGLDARLREQLGAALFTPRDFLARCPGQQSLQGAAETCGWPTLQELRGRILFTVHGYTTVGHDVTGPNPGVKALEQYGLGDAQLAVSRVGFVAPLFLTVGDDWKQKVSSHPEVLFHTEVHPDARFMGTLRNTFPGQIFRSNDRPTAESFRSAQLTHNFALTDHVSFHHYDYARTHNRFGYPFCPVGVAGADCWGESTHVLSSARERAHLMALEVRSGDIEGQRDSFAFAYDRSLVSAPTVWSAFISNSSNSPHSVAELGIHHWAKGCLMARASDAADSPYYAVCRAGDEEELFIQYRAGGCDGACGTARAAASLGRGIEAEDATFVRLALTPVDGGVVAQGYGSADGQSWQAIGEPVRFAGELPLQGIAASSNDPSSGNADGTPTRFYFGNLKRNDSRYTLTAFEGTQQLTGYANVGEVASARRLDLSYFGKRDQGSCDFSPLW